MIAAWPSRPSSAPDARPRGAAAAPSFWIGVALILAGLAVLGYVAWQFFGTNIVAHRSSRTSSTQTEQAVAVAGRRGASGTAQGVELKGAEALIRIPRFGKNYVMPVQAGRLRGVLAEGFGHFEGTADAGPASATTRSPRTGSPTASRCATCPSCGPATRSIVETRDATYTYRLDTNPNDLIVTLHRRLGDRPAADEPARRRRAGAASRPAADHADHLRGAVPHRQPDDRLRPPGHTTSH